MILSFALLIIFIFLSAFFSSSESALLSTSKAKIISLVDTKKPNILLKKLKEKQDEVIISILIGNNLVNIGATAIATQIALEFSKDFGVAIVTGVMTLTILTVGEIIPKIFATSYKDKYLISIAGTLYLWYKMVWPIVFVYKIMIDFFREHLNVKSSPTITEDELEEMIKIGVMEGQIQKEEHDYLIGAMELNDKTAENVMVPRNKMFAINQLKTVSDLLQLMKKEKRSYSRIPIFNKNPDKITGIINVRDILNIIHTKNWEKRKLKKLARKPLFVSKYTPLNDVIEKMKNEKQLLSLVIDENASVIGLISLEDILEEVIGEVYDEFDTVERKIWRTKDKAYIVAGDLAVSDLNDQTHIKLPDDVLNVAEFVMFKLRDIPKKGDTFIFKNYKFEIKKVKKNKVLTVKIKKL
ncbi:hemolysin family protein [Candidatus Micrarchaeota archaeon]|nr:hemolysin family protein [Candidatus Micrarchaeota archaeon]